MSASSIIAVKEAHVKPQTGARELREGSREPVVRPSRYAGPEAPAQLSEEQRRVLDSLHAAQSGLTSGMLQTRTGLSDAALQEALEGLIARYLVTRLNTLVPSYARRYPGIPV